MMEAVVEEKRRKVQIIKANHEVTDDQKNQLREIFFLCSSRKKFESQEQRDDFFYKWTGYYFEFEPESIYLALENDKVAGYLMGCRESRRACDFYSNHNKSYFAFEDLFDRFPAHLHINCHPSYQGLGIGGQLVDRFLLDLNKSGCAGVHIVTGQDSRNVKFYLRKGMTFTALRSWDGYDVYFMGKEF